MLCFSKFKKHIFEFEGMLDLQGFDLKGFAAKMKRSKLCLIFIVSPYHCQPSTEVVTSYLGNFRDVSLIRFNSGDLIIVNTDNSHFKISNVLFYGSKLSIHIVDQIFYARLNLDMLLFAWALIVVYKCQLHVNTNT